MFPIKQIDVHKINKLKG